MKTSIYSVLSQNKIPYVFKGFSYTGVLTAIQLHSAEEFEYIHFFYIYIKYTNYRRRRIESCKPI